MKKFLLSTVLGATMLASPVMAEELLIYHTWSSEAEVAALNVVKDDFEAKGHSWSDLAIPHDTGSNVSLMNLITGGNAPNIFMEGNPGVYRDLKGLGLTRPLDDFYKEQGILEHLPASVIASITVDGEILKVPQAIHIDGMAYYNKEVAKAAGVDPESWTSLEDMWADFEKVKEAGYVPLAIGAQGWQVGYLTHALAAAAEGPDFYKKIYGGTVDETAIDSAEMRDLLMWLRRFQSIADEGSANRDWNVTTNTVITGKALMQIHGDWMKGEWRAAGKVAGTDYGCMPIPGAKAVVVTVDAWGILGGQSAEIDAAELDFVASVLDPKAQASFASLKGSTPVRLDVDMSTLDVCGQAVIKALGQLDKQVQNPHSTVDADWQSSLWDVLFNYWSDPSMTADAVIAQLKDNYETILK